MSVCISICLCESVGYIKEFIIMCELHLSYNTGYSSRWCCYVLVCACFVAYAVHAYQRDKCSHVLLFSCSPVYLKCFSCSCCWRWNCPVTQFSCSPVLLFSCLFEMFLLQLLLALELSGNPVLLFSCSPVYLKCSVAAAVGAGTVR